MTQDVLVFAQKRVAVGERIALVSVTGTTGSSPANLGQMMAVTAQGETCGTVGGGATEHSITQRAVQAIRNDERVFEFAYDHSENGMVCGGGMRGFGNVLGHDNHLYIFGGGHIGQHLAPLARATGFFVTVVEDREELADNFADVRYLTTAIDALEESVCVNGTPYAVICTRGHGSDNEALRFCLGKSFRYIGMVGSSKKVATIFEGLRCDGIPEEVLAKLYTPIGLDIASGTPGEIAVSILAELLLVKNNGSLRHKRDKRL